MTEPVKINNQALDDFLAGDLGDFLSSTKDIDTTVKEMQVAQLNGVPTPAGVTAALEGFLEKGATVLDTMTIYCNNMPDSESVNSFASLMNSLTGAINNIAALYKIDQAQRNRLEIEDKKHEHKLKELEYRSRLKATLKNAQPGDPQLGMKEADTMIEVSTSDIVDQYLAAKKA